MSQIETLKALTQRANEKRLERLASQIETLRQAKAASVEELAQQIEPLAQALAALAEETGQSLNASQQAAEGARAALEAQVGVTVREIQNVAQKASQSLSGLRTAAQGLTWRLWLASSLTAAVTAALLSGLWLWQQGQAYQSQQERLMWLEKTAGGLNRYLVNELYPNLNAQRRAEIEALYQQLGLIAPQRQFSGN